MIRDMIYMNPLQYIELYVNTGRDGSHDVWCCDYLYILYYYTRIASLKLEPKWVGLLRKQRNP